MSDVCELILVRFCETLGVASVLPSIRLYAMLFLGKRKKNVPSAFLINFTVLAIFAKNCPNFAFLE